MQAISATTYISGNSSVHRLDARSKLILLIVYSVSLFFVDSWIGLFIYSFLFFLALALSHLPLKKVFFVVVPVYVLVGFTVLFNSFQFFGAEASGFTFEGFIRGLYFAIRILLLVWASLILSYTTTSTELTYALTSLMRPLAKLKVPVDDISMVFSVALRFIPLTAQEFFNLKDAQWSRGASFGDGGIFSRIKAHSIILLPMMVGLFRRADRLAIAMESRCYGMAGISRTSIHAKRPAFASIAVLLIGSAVCIAIALIA